MFHLVIISNCTVANIRDCQSFSTKRNYKTFANNGAFFFPIYVLLKLCCNVNQKLFPAFEHVMHPSEVRIIVIIIIAFTTVFIIKILVVITATITLLTSLLIIVASIIIVVITIFY